MPVGTRESTNAYLARSPRPASLPWQEQCGSAGQDTIAVGFRRMFHPPQSSHLLGVDSLGIWGSAPCEGTVCWGQALSPVETSLTHDWCEHHYFQEKPGTTMSPNTRMTHTGETSKKRQICHLASPGLGAL